MISGSSNKHRQCRNWRRPRRWQRSLGVLQSTRSVCINSFIPAISIAPLQVLYYSEALPTTTRILYRSFTPKRTSNCM